MTAAQAASASNAEPPREKASNDEGMPERGEREDAEGCAKRRNPWACTGRQFGWRGVLSRDVPRARQPVGDDELLYDKHRDEDLVQEMESRRTRPS
jgi:hypothetical protein